MSVYNPDATAMSHNAHLSFPPYLHISNNHYSLAWQHRAVHRIKNMVIMMEYIPNARNLRHRVGSTGSAASAVPDLSPKQIRKVGGHHRRRFRHRPAGISAYISSFEKITLKLSN
eukprot:7251602-Pyramimonas_sp.AAC.1